MENVNENVTKNEIKDSKEKVNIKSYIYKHSSTIAIVLSIISILFSGFALFNTKKPPRRDQHMFRQFDVQADMKDNYFNNGSFNKPNSNHFYGQRPNNNNQQDFNEKKSRSNKPDRNFKHRNAAPSNNNSNSDNPSTNNKGPQTAPKISPNNQ